MPRSLPTRVSSLFSVPFPPPFGYQIANVYRTKNAFRLAPGGDTAEQRLAPLPLSGEPLISMELPQHAATRAAYVAALVAADVGADVRCDTKRRLVFIKCT